MVGSTFTSNCSRIPAKRSQCNIQILATHPSRITLLVSRLYNPTHVRIVLLLQQCRLLYETGTARRSNSQPHIGQHIERSCCLCPSRFFHRITPEVDLSLATVLRGRPEIITRQSSGHVFVYISLVEGMLKTAV